MLVRLMSRWQARMRSVAKWPIFCLLAVAKSDGFFLAHCEFVRGQAGPFVAPIAKWLRF